MPSEFESVPSKSRKRDPAWKYCQILKDGNRVQVKCVYCAKLFRGGGIYRIKEHLACRKGNGSTCDRVPPDVRQAMKQSLDCVVVRKRRKKKMGDEVNETTTSISLNSNDGVDTFTDECVNNLEVPLMTYCEPREPDLIMMSLQDEEMGTGVLERRKRGMPLQDACGSHVDANDLLVVSDSHVVVNGLEAPLKKVNSQAQLAIGRFLLDIGVPLDAVNSVYFQPMIDSMSSEGAALVGPSHHDLHGWILKNEVNEGRAYMDYCEMAWERTGSSVMVEECSLEKGMKCLNFLVYNSEGTMFFKSVDVTNIAGSTERIFESIKQVLEEIGVKNVLQVITPNDECYAIAGKRLYDTYPTLYWTPCAASSVILMLEDFGKFEWIHSTVEQCKLITMFVYNHSVLLNMMRKYTYGVDLVVPGINPVATSFRTVKRIVDLKHNLQSLVSSQEWIDSHYSIQEGGLLMLDLINDHSFWSSCNMIVRLIDPLLRALNIFGSDTRPAMGYVYAAIYRVKEMLKREFRKRKDYMAYWNIIDHRWAHHQQHPLYAAGFYLNPKFFYSIERHLPCTIVSGMFDCIERLVPDTKIQDKIGKELNYYKNAAGDFGRNMAIRARESLLPSEWWSTYGAACPNLSHLAVRILGQRCSLMSCKQDFKPLEQMHKTTNSLEHQRLTDLLFTQYNLRLRQMAHSNKEHDDMDPLLVDNHDSVADWIASKETCLNDPESYDWMSIKPPTTSKMLMKSSVDEIEQLGIGFDDDDIFSGIKDDEDTIEG